MKNGVKDFLLASLRQLRVNRKFAGIDQLSRRADWQNMTLSNETKRRWILEIRETRISVATYEFPLQGKFWKIRSFRLKSNNKRRGFDDFVLIWTNNDNL